MHRRQNPNTTKSGNEKIPTYRINEQITGVKEVRLVTEGSSEIVPIEEALKRAREANLDLVEINNTQEISVCKITDYGKFRFELLKKQKEARKKQHVITVKELKLRPRIDSHDYEIKKKQIIEFLQKGDKVKITLRFKGREMSHPDLGMNIVKRLIEDLKDYGSPEKPPLQDGKQIVTVINPK
jgi:translation initiation factor IF-3